MQRLSPSMILFAFLIAACSSNSSPDAHTTTIDAPASAIDAHASTIDAAHAGIDAAEGEMQICASLDEHWQSSNCNQCLEQFETSQNHSCDTERTTFNTDCIAYATCYGTTSGACFTMANCSNPAPTSTCLADVAAYDRCVVVACGSSCTQ